MPGKQDLAGKKINSHISNLTRINRPKLTLSFVRAPTNQLKEEKKVNQENLGFALRKL